MEVPEGPVIVTSGLPYANGPCHIAHLRSYAPPDVYVRLLRKLGVETVFVCGSDTHGSPISVEAERRGITPEELVDHYHRHFIEVFRKLRIEFDNYGSTDDPINHEMARRFVETMRRKGLIYPREVEFPYCPRCDRFLPDRYVQGTCPYCGTPNVRGDECDLGCGRYLAPGEVRDPRCAICGSPATMKRRRHYFFKLTAFSSFLKGYLERLRGTDIARKYALRWLEAGLRDWCITRDLRWGIKFPGEPDLTLYVWWDAPIGYISSTIEWAERTGGDWERLWKGDGKIVHFIGSGITYHHALFWPSMLKGAGYNVPWAIVASGAVKIKGKPFSKTRGYVVWVEDDYLKRGFDPDCLRYYVLSFTSHVRDLNFSWEDYQAKVNDELVAALGNFVHRTLVFAHRHWGAIPSGAAEEAVLDEIQRTIDRVKREILDYRFKRACDAVLTLAHFGNRYFHRNEPWSLIKTDRDRCAGVIYNCLLIARALAVLMEPMMPGKAEELWRQLGEEGDVHSAPIEEAVKPIEPHEIPRPRPIFRKVSDREIEEVKRIIDERIRRAARTIR